MTTLSSTRTIRPVDVLCDCLNKLVRAETMAQWKAASCMYTGHGCMHPSKELDTGSMPSSCCAPSVLGCCPFTVAEL